MKNAKMKRLIIALALVAGIALVWSCPKNYGYGPFEALGSTGKLSEIISESGSANSVYPVAVALSSQYSTNSGGTMSRTLMSGYAWYMNRTGSTYTGVANDSLEIYYSDTLANMYSNNGSTAYGLLFSMSLSGINFASTSYSPTWLTGISIPATNMTRMMGGNHNYYIGLRFKIGGSTFSLPATTANLLSIVTI